MKPQEDQPWVHSIRFSDDGTEYPLDIIDANGNRWVTSAQVGEALGSSRITNLIAELSKKGEMVEGKHFCTLNVQKSASSGSHSSTLNVQKSVRGNPNIIVLSYRGIIRVSMHSEGRRASKFRDWAEDVLFEVMTTGRVSQNVTYAKVAKASQRELENAQRFWDFIFGKDTFKFIAVEPARKSKGDL
jgi:prophage antirepressor-like protein